MKLDFEKYAPRLAEITREFLRTRDVEAWADAYGTVCAEAIPGTVNDIVGAARRLDGAAMCLLSPPERIRLSSILMTTTPPSPTTRLWSRICAIKAQREVPS